ADAPGAAEPAVGGVVGPGACGDRRAAGSGPGHAVGHHGSARVRRGEQHAQQPSRTARPGRGRTEARRADRAVRVMTTLDLSTPPGPARATLHRASEGRALLLLGHGAGGGVDAADLVAVTRTATAAGVHVALVEQPYRVAGRRAPAPARQLDAAWLAVLVDLREGPMAGLPVVTGGRSSGARVACRCSGDGVARAVLCLAFPLLPPGKEESKSRLPELDGVAVPALVVQGRSDRFGMPPEAPGRKVVTLAGTHALASDLDGLSSAFGQWLAQLLTD